MEELRFALIGAGFWAQYQLAAWQELPGARCVAIVDSQHDKAEALANRFGIVSTYDHATRLLESQQVDFVDIVTDVDSHPQLVELAASHGVDAICQKPMAASLKLARAMVDVTRGAGTRLLIHENWRWQAPLRRLKEIIDSGCLGNLVRARIDYANSFPVFDNQPFLKELDQFILTDIGTHILDVARFLFGQPRQLYCQTRRMRPDIAGEDVATVLLSMDRGLSVACNMSYASKWQYDQFPQTMVFIEGTRGGVSLDVDYRITVYGDAPAQETVDIPRYAWADPAYALIHSSIVDCHRNLLSSLRGQCVAETTGEDNLKTLELVYSAYQSAADNVIVPLDENGDASS